MKNLITILILMLTLTSCCNDVEITPTPKEEICGVIQDGIIELASDVNGNPVKDKNGEYIKMYFVFINGVKYKVSGITYQLSQDKTKEHYTCVTK